MTHGAASVVAMRMSGSATNIPPHPLPAFTPTPLPLLCSVGNNLCHYCLEADPQKIPGKSYKGNVTFANIVLNSVTFSKRQVNRRETMPCPAENSL